MRLWQAYAALTLLVAVGLAAMVYASRPPAHVIAACKAASSALEREVCAALGR